MSCIPTAATILLQLSLWLLVTPLLVATNENQGDVAVMPDGMPDPEKSQHIEDLVVESLQLQDDAAQFLACARASTALPACPPALPAHPASSQISGRGARIVPRLPTSALTIRSARKMWRHC